ncbi:unnamed protein product [Tetraodon nigroviridis]|uniref:(spotted green pufferfish) hypothetical protein n=1 Tax=Tetraodon nigroviridis TaxID=99883 RepID=Q4SS38_TETNG|nr:unnamed protein product [Tetraodon nigroviridis]
MVGVSNALPTQGSPPERRHRLIRLITVAEKISNENFLLRECDGGGGAVTVWLSAAEGVRTIKRCRHSPRLSHHPDASVSRVDRFITAVEPGNGYEPGRADSREDGEIAGGE